MRCEIALLDLIGENMDNDIPRTCATCEEALLERGGAAACEHYRSTDGGTRACGHYRCIGTDSMRLDADRTFSRFAEWDGKLRDRIGGTGPDALRDLMARDLVKWMQEYDIRSVFHLDDPLDCSAGHLIGMLDAKPTCHADRIAAALMERALDGDPAAWREVDRLLSRLDAR